jgi:hypothetical protein
MKTICWLVAMLATALTVAGGAEQTSPPRPLVIVFAGESNSGGLALNKSATPSELAPQPSVQGMNLTNGRFSFEDLQIGVNNLQKHGALNGKEKPGVAVIDSTGAGLIDKNHWNYAGP